MILVTGSNGLLGQAVIKRLHSESKIVRGSVREPIQSLMDEIVYVPVGAIDKSTDWSTALLGIRTVVHTAARVHVMHDKSTNALDEFRVVNVDGTINLARQAVKSGVKRFIYISSIKVNGEYTIAAQPFTEADIPLPADPYGVSKLEAEAALYTLSEETEMEVVCIRPPLVYGVGVKANFFKMMEWLYKGTPLPFGAIDNKRSLVGLDNLVDLIITCIEHPSASNQTFLVSDGEDLSTSELLYRVARALNKKPFLLPVDQKILEFSLKLIGKKDLSQRLCSSLQVDISKAKALLSWTPPVSLDEGLRKTAENFLSLNINE